MKKNRFFTIILFNFFLVFIPAAQAQEHAATEKDERYLLLVSFDGFRSDYAQRWQLPNFLAMAREGTSAEGLQPSYPSLTFPNHYTLVTGLYPGSHGLVANSFHDPQRKLGYSMGKRSAVEDPGFYGGLPLWQFVQQQGRHAAAFFWVGSEAPIAGSFPDYYRNYDESVANSARVEQALAWLRLPQAERPAFISLYFSLVDHASHESGPLSAETRAAAEEADVILGQLLTGLDSLALPVDLVLVSDHGMYPVQENADAFIYLPELAQAENETEVIYSQTQVMLYSDDKARLEHWRQTFARDSQHYSVYRKAETPVHWHYNEHSNIGDLLLVAEPGFVFSRTPVDAARLGNKTIGVHGYDPHDVPELYGIFYARGPHVQRALKLPLLDNIHVLPFLTELLDLPVPAGIDGSATVLHAAVLPTKTEEAPK